MYVAITNDVGADVHYPVIRTLSFAPSADPTGTSLPINEFTVELMTSDTISTGRVARLYDDRDTLWAKYNIIEAERINDYTLRLRAQSDVAFLDRVTLYSEYFDNVPVKDVLDNTIVNKPGLSGIIDYSLDSSFEEQTITGYCPEQSARERLMWVCFVIGAYVKTFFNEQIEILPLSTNTPTIPLESTYATPRVSTRDLVTKVRLYYYTFTEGTPTSSQEWVETEDGRIFIKKTYKRTAINTDAPADAPVNEVNIEGVFLVNSGNRIDILDRIKPWYFRRDEVELEAINNGNYLPGGMANVYTEPDVLRRGTITSCEFTFGLQAKAKLKLTGVVKRATGVLTARYVWDDLQLAEDHIVVLVPRNYILTTRYITIFIDGELRRFRPTRERVSVRVTAEGATTEITCEEVIT